MKLWDIVKTVGTGIISTALPGGAAIVGAINALLPDDKKLPENATGTQAVSAINSLPPEQQIQLMEKQFDVDITQIKESNSTLRMMLENDAKMPHTTRPYVVMHSFHLVAAVTLMVMLAWLYSVVDNNVAMTKAVMGNWPFVASIVAPFVTMLLAYFGVLKKEAKNRLDAASGVTAPTGLTGLLSAFSR